MLTKPKQKLTPAPNFWRVGKFYCIRTVTMIDTGKLVGITPTEIILEDAAWIADTGRFHQALKTGVFEEVEPFPAGLVCINRAAVIDACEIPLLPREVK